MRVQWTGRACANVVRLHEFLFGADPSAAARVVKALVAALSELATNPRIGERLEEFNPREIRRLLVGRYEMRYEIEGMTIYVMRIWHTREAR